MNRVLSFILLLALLGCGANMNAQNDAAEEPAEKRIEYGWVGGLTVRAYREIPEDAGSHVYLYQLAWPGKYEIDAPNGDYELRLHFVQNEKDGKPENNGVITVLAEGKKILDQFPTFEWKQKERGTVTPVVKEAEVTVSDGQLNLLFPYDEVSRPAICGIELIGKSNDLALRINCGGPRPYTDPDGKEWVHDRRKPIPLDGRVTLEPVTAKNTWINVSDDMLVKLRAVDVGPLPRWWINAKDKMGVVALFSDRAGNTYANIIGNGIWKYDIETNAFYRVDGGKLDAQINSRSANNGNSGEYIQLVLNPNGAGFAPICWSSDQRNRGQVVCPDDGETFINFWQPSDCWDFGTVDWTTNPPELFFIVHHHSKGEAWVSTDGGQSFEIIFDQGSRVQALGTIGPYILLKALSREYARGEYVDNPEEDKKLVGIHRSTDLGKTWEKVSDIELRDWKGSMVYYKGDAWFNTPDGLALSEDEGKTWKIVPNSPTFTQPVVYGEKDNEMMGVNHEGFFFSDDTGRSWTKVLDAPENTGYYFWDPTRDIFYAGQYNGEWYRYNRAK
ncbi:MAG: hypothetical protein ACLFUS_16415 [Candidatus Sumerlaeia bacterium]